MERSNTFEDWKERRAANLADQEKNGYTISLFDRGEILKYSDAIVTVTLETSFHPTFEVNIVPLLDHFRDLTDGHLSIVIKRLVDYLTTEAKSLYVECQSKDQSQMLAEYITANKIINEYFWSIRVIEKNIALFYDKVAA